MSNWQSTPPSLISISQCNTALDFSPVTHWPQGLPAVAINQVVIAGFDQDLAFNHDVDLNSTEKIVQIFRSLYPELSFIELARFCDKANQVSWIPTKQIILAFGLQPSEFFLQVAALTKKLPAPIQTWCAEKKLGPQDLAPLISASTLDLSLFWNKLTSLNLSKSQGVFCLELIIELSLMGKSNLDLGLERDVARSEVESWINNLRALRNPETYARDLQVQEQILELPWPGTSQVRWARHGDRAGVEVKLFVSQPSDLKKYIYSLNQVQDLLEKNSVPKIQH